MPYEYDQAGFLIDYNAVRLGLFTEINFTGAGVVVTSVNGVATVTISGIGIITVNNTVFVMKNGSDATGTRQRLDLPFLTLSAAQTAAQSGDTIIVYPGTYTSNGLGKNGVNWYFYLGANIVTTGVLWDCTNLVFSVDGLGIFNTTDASGRCLKMDGSTITFNCKYMQKDAGVIGSVLVENQSVLYLRASDYIYSNGNNIFTNTSSIVYVYTPIAQSKRANLVSTNAGTSYYFIENIITSNTNADLNCSIFNSGGEQYVYGTQFYDCLNTTGAGIQMSAGGAASTIVVKGNLYHTNGICAVQDTNNNAGTSLRFDGDIKTTDIATMGQIKINGNAANRHFFNGNYQAKIQETGMILVTLGIAEFRNGTLKNTSNFGNLDAVCLNMGTTVIFKHCNLITTNAGADCLQLGAGGAAFNLQNITMNRQSAQVGTFQVGIYVTDPNVI